MRPRIFRRLNPVGDVDEDSDVFESLDIDDDGGD
jgi:hypothetical protein